MYSQEKQRKAQAEKDKQNKSRFPKGKKFVDIGAWLGDLEQKQALKGEKIVGSGHTFAKQKFETKEDYDKTKGRK